jgi:hypothetical protein
MKMLHTGKGINSKVDDDVYWKLKDLIWFQTSTGRDAYFATGHGKTLVRLHHFIVGKPPKGYVVDHANGDITDNQRQNLRIVTHSQSAMNRRKFKGTKFKGVYPNNPGKNNKSWRAVIHVNKRKIRLGSFPSMEQAAEAYLAAQKKYHGQYARRTWLQGQEAP